MIKRVLIVLFLIVGMNYSIDLSFAAQGDSNSVFWKQWWGEKLWLTNWSLVGTILNAIKWLMGFLYIVAVIYWLYGWWNILTAWWDDKKVWTWKSIIINALIWLVVIFLASTIVTFVFSLLDSNSTTTAPQ
jgi:hypothetical protein